MLSPPPPPPPPAPVDIAAARTTPPDVGPASTERTADRNARRLSLRHLVRDEAVGSGIAVACGALAFLCAGPMPSAFLLPLSSLALAALAFALGAAVTLVRVCATPEPAEVVDAEVHAADGVVPPTPPSPTPQDLMQPMEADGGATTNRRVDRALDALLSGISHELRTPLTSILASTEILGMFAGEDPATRAEFLSIIEREARRLLRIVGLVIDMTKIDSDSLELHCADMEFGDLVADALDALRDSARARGVHLRLTDELDRRLPCDAERIETVLHTVLRRAIGATPRGAAIELRLAREGRVVALRVEHPIATDEERAEAAKAEDDSLPFHSTATGLEVAPRVAVLLVRAHGGTLTLRENGFELTLPLEAARPVSCAGDSGPPPPPSAP
jgi:signal transduction histidine kinase